ncbi:MAG TPA: prepilin peptidase, partial [Candidatus Saccharimonadales bacterium]|nr:prepilin peptidase [Candidatus Saccharimonadales bacterium]
MVTALLFVVGLAFGSFAGAVVWRLHEGRNFVTERSECENCHHHLSVGDLVPVISWVALRGKCRYCHHKISVELPLVELLTGCLFALSWIYWPGTRSGGAFIVDFVFWLVFLVGALILTIYDFKWKLLPDKIVFPLIALALIYRLQAYFFFHGGFGSLESASFGVVIMSGFFGLLYLLSRGKWIGLGDVKLGVFLGLVLGAGYGFVALVMSYYIGALAVTPLLISRRLKTRSVVAFGPYLLISFVITFLFGHHITN